jgi:hypothetical protein
MLFPIYGGLKGDKYVFDGENIYFLNVVTL